MGGEDDCDTSKWLYHLKLCKFQSASLHFEPDGVAFNFMLISKCKFALWMFALLRQLDSLWVSQLHPIASITSGVSRALHPTTTTMTKSKNAPFELGKYTGQPFAGVSSVGIVTVVKSTKKWIKFRRYDRSIGHGKVKSCVLPSGALSYYVEVGRFNTIYPAQ